MSAAVEDGAEVGAATRAGRGPVGEYFAVNLRQGRQARGLSQAELAHRVTTMGHPCTQATIWKLEQGHREPKLSEAAAIGAALGLPRWTDLTVRPAAFSLEFTIGQCRRRVCELAEGTRAAAAAHLDALASLELAVREAQDAGLSLTGGWLDPAPGATVLREALAALSGGRRLRDADRSVLAEHDPARGLLDGLP